MTGAAAGVGFACIMFTMLVTVAMSITLLAINNVQLYGMSDWCLSLPGGDAVACLRGTDQCWASQEPLSDMVPCKYLYAVGAIGLVFQVVMGFLPCMESMAATIAMAVTGFLNFGWWIAAGIYFTVEFKDVPSFVPAGNYRDAVLGVTWTAFGMSVVQLLSVGMATLVGRRSLKEKTVQAKASSEATPLPLPTYAGPVQA